MYMYMYIYQFCNIPSNLTYPPMVLLWNKKCIIYTCTNKVLVPTYSFTTFCALRITTSRVNFKRKKINISENFLTIKPVKPDLHMFKATHLCCVRMTCNTPNPSHPSTADDGWYWQKCVLCIG
jgi:hypothetical protein